MPIFFSERENLSRAEVTGLVKAGDLAASIKARPTYIEQVGRATEVEYRSVEKYHLIFNHF